LTIKSISNTKCPNVHSSCASLPLAAKLRPLPGS